jgi:site-specific DNA-methyltransferase (adenine-specific)/adenine-specific DNA-methyltransferase
MINKEQKDYIIQLLQEGKDIPEDFKYQLFPTKQKEYELAYAGKMRKEDILANEDGVFPVPLQVEKVFNGNEYEAFDDDWKNMIVFGDNLQFLKTIYENKEPLIKNKVKGKVKLIYIDPPFATEEDFKGKDGQKAYTDKAKGSQFIEFLRKRLIVAKEILHPQGLIYVHLDTKKSHYIKVIMDEIFNENNFQNEIVYCYAGGATSKKDLPRKHDTIFRYSNSDTYFYKPALRQYSQSGSGRRSDGSKYDVTSTTPHNDWWTDISPENTQSNDNTGYPTQKPEQLIKRIIEISTEEGDLIFDFFGGSGTTIATAEKMGRKWIACDVGKLSYLTMQKRILQIQESKDLEDPKKKYGKKAKSFTTASLGSYDLEKTFELERKKYLEFVSGLFEVNLKEYKISGFSFEGKKDSYPVIIYDYNTYKDSSIDENYLQDIHRNIGKKVGSKVYIIAPINFVDFVDDSAEIDDVRYYFLKIPYHIINELHKKPFVKVRQPQTKSRVNDIEEAIGFHFKRPPEVKAELKIETDEIKLIIKSFKTNELQSDKTKEEKSFENFETLSAVFIDKTYNGKSFEMDEAFFANELLPKKKSKKKIETAKNDNSKLDGNITENLKKLSETGIEISLKTNEVEEQLMVVFTDIYGNDFTQTFKV